MSSKMSRNILHAIRILKGGGIVIFPTDTAFGIGCRIDSERAIRRLFELRKRSKEKAVPVLCSSIRMVREYVKNIDSDVLELMRKYWPGGLTLVLEGNLEKVPGFVRGGGKAIGIRIPGHSVIRKIIKKVGVPILGPSANFSGGKTPFKISDLDPELVRSVDYVLPGRCKIKKPSTVLDCTVKPWKIIRSGTVSLNKQISKTQISK